MKNHEQKIGHLRGTVKSKLLQRTYWRRGEVVISFFSLFIKIFVVLQLQSRLI